MTLPYLLPAVRFRPELAGGGGTVCVECGGESALVLSGVFASRESEPPGFAVDVSLRAAEPGRKGPQPLCNRRLCRASLHLWRRICDVAGQDDSAAGRSVAAALGPGQDELHGSATCHRHISTTIRGRKRSASLLKRIEARARVLRSDAQEATRDPRRQSGVAIAAIRGAGDRDSM